MKRFYLFAGLLFTLLVAQGCGGGDGGGGDAGPGGNGNNGGEIIGFCGEYVSASGGGPHTQCYSISDFQGDFEAFKTQVRNNWQTGTDTYCASRAGQTFAIQKPYMKVAKKNANGELLDLQTEEDNRGKCPDADQRVAFYTGEFVSASGTLRPNDAQRATGMYVYDITRDFKGDTGYNNLKWMVERAWKCTTLLWCRTHVDQNYSVTNVYYKIMKLNSSRQVISGGEETVQASETKCPATAAEVTSQEDGLKCSEI